MIKLKFHRNKKMLYLLVIPEVYIDGQLVKTLNNGETYEHYVEEGEHEIMVIAQIATIRKTINVQRNMEFNIDLHANSFDLEILYENGEKYIDAQNKTSKQENGERKIDNGKISAKNDFSNKSYWKSVWNVVLIVAVPGILYIVYLIIKIILGNLS